MSGPTREPAAVVSLDEKRTPSSGGSLALPLNGSYSEHEQPGIGLEGSGLPSAVGSESFGVAAKLNAAYSVAHSAKFSHTNETKNESDPSFPHADGLKHISEVLYLEALEGLVEEDEWRASLVEHRKEGSSGSLESIAEVDESAEEEENSPSRAADAAFSNLSRKKSVHLLKRARRNAQVEKERAAAVVTSGRSQHLDWSAYDSWKKSPPEDDGGMDSSRWCDRRHMFEGLGYGATVQQASAQQELVRQWTERANATKLSAGYRRAARREKRLREGGTYYLAIARNLPKPEEKCAASGGVQTPAAKTWSSDIQKMEDDLSFHASASDYDVVTLGDVSRVSTNVSDDVYSAIDTGTTLTIMDLADGTRLDGFNPDSSVKIMGFNGSVSRSRGQGTAVGFGTARDGSRVTLRVPKVHNLPGAPNDLLSVSAMVTLGYEFHFTRKSSWIVTPELDVIDVVERAGLYWLKWRKAITPAMAAATAVKEPATTIVEPPIVSDHVLGHAPLNKSSGSHASSSKLVEVAPSWTQKSDDLVATATGEAKKQLLGAKEAYSTELSESNQSIDHREKVLLEKEQSANDSKLQDDSHELNHMELAVGQSDEGCALKNDQAGAERLKYLFDPVKDAVKPCGDEACFTCCSGSRVKESKVPLQLLHRRLGHFDSRVIERMAAHRAIDVTLSDHKMCECAVCKAVKATRRSVPKQREYERVERKPWERVWTDVKGKVCQDFRGNQYVVTFTDELTRYSYVAFCQRKSQVKERFTEFLSWVKLQGHRVRLLNSDGGGEYTSNENANVASDFSKICKAHDIEQQFTSVHTPSQNGIAERLNRTLVEHASCLLHEAGLAKEFWSFAVKHVAWIRNRFHHSALEDKSKGNAPTSPFEQLHGRTPRVAMARVFGCDVWALDHSHRSGSFEQKARKGIFVGISANRKGWIIFDPKTRKCYTTFHASFDESLDGRRCALRDFDLRECNTRHFGRH